MRITEKKLLDNYDGITNGLSNISVINGEKIWWSYREPRDGDGFNPVTHDRNEAGSILLEYSRTGYIPLNKCCDNHPAARKIYDAVRKVLGSEI